MSSAAVVIGGIKVNSRLQIVAKWNIILLPYIVSWPLIYFLSSFFGQVNPLSGLIAVYVLLLSEDII